ncbi:GtrA family protein [Yersinia frederiksenii]|uniref:GtrA family protein n=1 Tax=Yersinia frederiksenii TaxID=29484 RepID=UPI0025AA9C4F|nr:GtrA family protein [Yersinia frederiksenii]MDN0118625.1 GtrA family protein [Yersinia frederiksenii]
MIKRQLMIFLIVGSLTVFIDFLTYRALITLDLLGIDMAKATGFIIGTIFAYLANRIWTFGRQTHASGSIWRFIVLYAVTLGINVWMNAIVLASLQAVQIAFLVATGISALLNFIGMKWFVFKSARKTELS